MKKIQHQLQDLTGDHNNHTNGSLLTSLDNAAILKGSHSPRHSGSSSRSNSLAAVALANMSSLRLGSGGSSSGTLAATSHADLSTCDGEYLGQPLARVSSMQSNTTGTSTEISTKPGQDGDAHSVASSTATGESGGNGYVKADHNRDSSEETLFEDAQHTNQSHELVIKLGTPTIQGTIGATSTSISALATIAAAASFSEAQADPTIISSDDVAVNQCSIELFQTATKCIQDLKAREVFHVFCCCLVFILSFFPKIFALFYSFS